MKKRLPIILLLINHLCTVNAQTYLSPLVGYQFSKNSGFSSEVFPLNDVISDLDYGSKYPMVGIGISQRLSGRIRFDLSGNYTRNFMKYSDTGIVGYTDLKFTRIGISAVPNFRLSKQCFLGFGLVYHALPHMALGKKDRDIWVGYGERYNQQQWGWVAGLNYQYRACFLELKYLNSFSKNTHALHFIKQTQSIEICLGYRFKVLDKIIPGKQKTICPKF